MAKVLALMSGGVDSSVTAHLLKKEGHEVVGLTLKLFELATEGPGCCGSPRDVYDAKECARIIGIPHYTLDEVDEFKKKVIDQFKEAYLKGETPNPCVECNRSMKFGKILDLAKAWGFDAVATGHYAKIEKGSVLLKAKDQHKDQSYFLYMLKGEQLPSIMFPIGDMTKDEVRAVAEAIELPTAKKPDSQDICFVGALGGDYRKLVGAGDDSGELVDAATGSVLGRHSGYFNFTVGQREGLGISLNKPAYVTKIDPQTKKVHIGDNEDLMKTNIQVGEVSWVHPLKESAIEAQVKIRYRSSAARAKIQVVNNETCSVVFDEPQRAPTPGQFAVFYDGEVVLGGGKIK